MANMCCYKVIVKGKKNSCYAFYGAMPCMDGIEISEESGTDDVYTICFKGNCKWAVDAYCDSWNGSFPVPLPKDPSKAMKEAEEQYTYYTVQDKSKMFGVEVWCVSTDTDDYESDTIYEHYINGEEAEGKRPFAFYIETETDELSDKERIKKYFEEDNVPFFSVEFDNAVLNEIIKKYNYFSETIEDPFNIDAFEENIPGYAGVKNLDNLTSTLISAIVSFGTSDDGFEDELLRRKKEIEDAFTYIDGTSAEFCNEEIQTGYDFRYEEGKYKSSYRTCEGGW